MKISKNLLRKLIREAIEELTKCSECGTAMKMSEGDKCSECEEKTKLQSLPIQQGFGDHSHDKTVRSHIASVDGKPKQTGWRAF